MATLEINGKRVEVDDSFRSLSPEQQQATVDEIAQSMGIQGQTHGSATERFLGQAARSMAGIADSVVTGAENDVRRLMGKEVIPYGEGRVQTAMENARIASPNEPDGVLEHAGSGFGDGMAALLPVAKALQAARGVGGMAGTIADDAYRSLASRMGIVMEPTASALSAGGREAAAEAGGGQVAQDMASLAAPLSIPAASQAMRGTGRAINRATDILPGTRFVKDTAKGVKKALVPMSGSGAREVARTRLQDLAGGPERAERVGKEISSSDPLGRTGAEQTGDPNLLGLQRSASNENPALRERLEDRGTKTREAATEAVRGDSEEVGDARTFFRRRLREYTESIEKRVDRILADSDSAMRDIGSGPSTSESSVRTVEALKAAFDEEKAAERALWQAIPKDVTMDLQSLKQAAREIIEGTPTASQKHIPDEVTALTGNLYGDATTFDEVHGLYSELRFVAREARAGDVPNSRRAAMADKMADTILEAFDEIDAETATGRLIADARAKTRALNETFRTGAPGRILSRTRQASERVPPETALSSTVGRGKEAGEVNARQIVSAAPEAAEDVQNYLRTRFAQSAINAMDEFSPRTARQWMRDNAQTLAQFPVLRRELVAALKSRESAQAFAVRAENRTKLAGQSALEAFNKGQPETAIKAILGADDPVQTARSIAATARKDPTGKALGGVKAAFSDYLTQDIDKLPAVLSDSRLKASMRQVFSSKELANLERIADAMRRMQVRPRDVGQVIDEPANRAVDIIVRMIAARRGGSLGGGSMGGSMQTANIFTERARSMLHGLQNDRARQLLFDAIEDPALMRELLTEVRTPQALERVRSRLAPYLTGALVSNE